MKVDNCSRLIAGFRIKNKGNGARNNWATKDFLVSGKNQTGSWQNLTEAQLSDTRAKPAPLLNFTFDKPYLVQFLKFDLVSFWGVKGGGLQYFAPIPATGKHKSLTNTSLMDSCIPQGESNVTVMAEETLISCGTTKKTKKTKKTSATITTTIKSEIFTQVWAWFPKIKHFTDATYSFRWAKCDFRDRQHNVHIWNNRHGNKQWWFGWMFFF